MRVPDVLYSLYERRLVRSLPRSAVPRHVGVILDGNRRWAKALGTPVSHGHRHGALKITELLEWSEEAGVEIVTLWMLSTDNLERDPVEVAELLEIIAAAVDMLADSGRRLRVVGSLDLLPPDVADRLRQAEARTAGGTGVQVNVAIGYGGRHEITDAVRALLRERALAGQTLAEAAEEIGIDDITDHLYTRGQPDPDLVIRTSGEQRLGGFLLWQSVHSEYYFCEVYWPDFRRVDFLRALRSYGQRERRLGR